TELGGDRHALVVPCDVSERAAVEAAAARVLEHWGRIDVLVNSAGVARHALFKDEDPETFVRLMETNYLGIVWAIRAVLAAMRARREGWAGVRGWRPRPATPPSPRPRRPSSPPPASPGRSLTSWRRSEST